MRLVRRELRFVYRLDGPSQQDEEDEKMRMFLLAVTFLRTCASVEAARRKKLKKRQRANQLRQARLHARGARARRVQGAPLEVLCS